MKEEDKGEEGGMKEAIRYIWDTWLSQRLADISGKDQAVNILGLSPI